jgi:hypothetical protein
MHTAHLEDHPENEQRCSVRSQMMKTIHESDEKCDPIVPYPSDVKMKLMADRPERIPATFRLSANYQQKLDQSKCQAVYPRATTTALRTSIAEHRAPAPDFRLPPRSIPKSPFSTTSRPSRSRPRNSRPSSTPPRNSR